VGGNSRKSVGLRRARLPAGLCMLFLAAVILCDIPAKRDSDHVSGRLAIVALVCLIGLVASGASIALVVWFNQPKFLVPPNCRAEAGGFSDWRASR
jgi:peptidoglycan/LPS O-acetylase OafA/YrhL